MNSPALLVIDMQLVAFDGAVTPPVNDGTRVLQNVADLIKICRSKNVPVVYLQTCAISGTPYAEDVHGWEIHPLVAPEPHDTIVKKVLSSGFENTHLDEVLKSISASLLITCGIWSEFCLTATSLDGAKLGYDILIASECHGTVAENLEKALLASETQNQLLAGEGLAVCSNNAIAALLETQ